MSSQRLPGLAAAKPAACAAFSRFQTSRWRLRRFAEHVGARDVGEIAVDRRAGVDQDHVAVLQRLRIGHAVRIGRRLAEQHRVEGRIAFRAELAVRGGEEGLHFCRGDALAHDAGGGLVGFERDVLGRLHQRDFVLRLDHAATGGDVDRVDEGVGVAGAAQPVEGEERRRLVDGDGAAGIAERAHGLGDDSGRILVLLPDRDLVAERRVMVLSFSTSKAGET